MRTPKSPQSPPPPECGCDGCDTEVDKDLVNRASLNKQGKKAWTKPTIVRLSDGLTRFESGPQPDTLHENSAYFILSS